MILTSVFIPKVNLLDAILKCALWQRFVLPCGEIKLHFSLLEITEHRKKLLCLHIGNLMSVFNAKLKIPDES